MTVSVTEREDFAVLEPSGPNLDQPTHEAMREVYEDLAGEDDIDIVIVDVRNLERLGAGGLAVLTSGRDLLRPDQEVFLCNCNRVIAAEIRAAGLDSVLPINDAVYKALQEQSSEGRRDVERLPEETADILAQSSQDKRHPDPGRRAGWTELPAIALEEVDRRTFEDDGKEVYQRLAQTLRAVAESTAIREEPPAIEIDPYPPEDWDFAEDLGDGADLQMVWIPGGTFPMGSPPSEDGRFENEGPVHAVRIEGFWMGRHLVTQQQYEQIMGTNPSHFQNPRGPVEMVSWHDAMDFCNRLSQQSGIAYTLPMEAQWEYACRSGSLNRFSFGDYDYLLDDHAWYSRNSRARTHTVGEKKPNAFGLYDMHGNVWEWCLSLYKDYSLEGDRERDDPALDGFRVLRGGSWNYVAKVCRSAFRFWRNPTAADPSWGFRVVALVEG
jgi:anti-anti-sigma factor